MKLLRWFMPGLRVKRWFLLFTLGIILCGIGFATIFGTKFWGIIEDEFYFVLRHFFRNPHIIAMVGLGILILGFTLTIIAFHATINSILEGMGPRPPRRIMDIVFEKRQLERGPKIVAIGGGTGLSNLLRGLKEFTTNITAIVAVSDDGGSSGRLREEFGVLPPGDIRNCLVALADKEPLMEKLFQHRFMGNNDFAGHSFGNLFIATLSEVSGDFLQAIKESSKVLAVRGKVYPGTLESITLGAELKNGETIWGETTVGKNNVGIKRVLIKPANVPSPPEVIEAIREADIVVLGPGSLYTSIMPNLLIQDILTALKKTKAVKIFVCNVMTQPGETEGYTVGDHVQAVLDHCGKIIDCIVIHIGKFPETVLANYRAEGRYQVEIDQARLAKMGIDFVMGNLADQSDLARHDSKKLASLILNLYERARPENKYQAWHQWMKMRKKQG